jgi:hypothetical protein
MARSVDLPPVMSRETPKLDHTPEVLGLVTQVLLLVALAWLLLAVPGCELVPDR